MPVAPPQGPGRPAHGAGRRGSSTLGTAGRLVGGRRVGGRRVGVLRVGVLLVSALLAGCGTGTSRPAALARTTPPPHPSPSPTPTRAVPSGPTACRLGVPVTLTGTGGEQIRLDVSGPSVHTGPFADWAYGPRYGYYLTFTASFVDTGRTPVIINPLNFLVNEPGDPDVNIYAGNAKYSGASRVLDHTFIDPGQSDAGPLNYDVPGVHGTLTYARRGLPTCVWRF